MKNKINLYLLVSLLYCLATACTFSTNEDEQSSVTLSPQKNLLNFRLDNQTPNWGSSCTYFQRGNTERVLFYSPVSEELFIFKPDIKEPLHKIVIESEGPNGIAEPLAFQMLATDSILVLTSYTKELILIDSLDKIQNKYTMITDIALARTWQSETSMRLLVSGNTCFIETIPNADPNNPRLYYNSKLGAAYNFKKQQLRINYISYPQVYKTGSYWPLFHNMYSICVNEKGHEVISFPLNSELIELDSNGNQLGKYESKSDFFVKEPAHLPKGTDERLHFLRQNSYTGLFYDPYRHVYYRFASQGLQDNLPMHKGPVVPATFMPTSVIIMDKDFIKIGEYKLPENTHYYLNAFVSKEGLCISNSHPFNKSQKEGQLQFTCYAIRANE